MNPALVKPMRKGSSLLYGYAECNDEELYNLNAAKTWSFFWFDKSWTCHIHPDLCCPETYRGENGD